MDKGRGNCRHLVGSSVYVRGVEIRVGVGVGVGAVIGIGVGVVKVS